MLPDDPVLVGVAEDLDPENPAFFPFHRFRRLDRGGGLRAEEGGELALLIELGEVIAERADLGAVGDFLTVGGRFDQGRIDFDEQGVQAGEIGDTAALIAAIEIGRPRIDPELSISIVTTVSRNSMSFSCLKDSGCCGSIIMRGRRAVSSIPSSRSKTQARWRRLGTTPVAAAISSGST